MPHDLLGIYKKWLRQFGGVGSSADIGLHERLDSLVHGGSPKRCGNWGEGVTFGRAHVVPKNNEKCRLVLNGMRMNVHTLSDGAETEVPPSVHCTHSKSWVSDWTPFGMG